MKILSAEQIREADLATMQQEPVSSIDLMERAAAACTRHLLNLLTAQTSFVHIVCGKGNNGGDGLAIARLLRKEFRELKRETIINVFIIEHSDKASDDFNINLERLEKTGDASITHIREEHARQLEDLLSGNKKNAIIVDAIFGSGLNKEVTGVAELAIGIINKSGIPVISIDLPSGLFADTQTTGKNKAVIQASLTLTFQQPKLAFMMAENGNFCGEFAVLDIGIDQEYIAGLPCTDFYLTRQDIQPLLLRRRKFAHKGTFGHALLLSGSYGKTGAALMAARACLRSGAGLLTTHIPACGVAILQAALPEAMVSADSEEEYISTLPPAEKFNSAGIGPGMGTEIQSGNVLKLLIQNFNAPLVIDADALNILSENKTWLGFLKPLTILTPHPKEFDRLTGAHGSDFDRLESAKEFAMRYRVIVILKGAHTAVVTPAKNVYFNSTGNPGMAKGGSGDVLTGMLTGLLARGYAPLEAALYGVFLHGLAGDLVAEQKGEESLLAGDLTEKIPAAILDLQH